MKIKSMPNPAFFDIFGILIFTFLIWVGYTNLNEVKPLSPLVAAIILIIGVLGLIIDVINVYRTYIK